MSEDSTTPENIRKHRERCNNYRKNNPEKYRNASLKYYYRNREKILAKRKLQRRIKILRDRIDKRIIPEDQVPQLEQLISRLEAELDELN